MKLKTHYYKLGAAMTMGMFAASGDAYAQATSGNNFSKIAQNITTSGESLPGLLSALSYLIGITLGVLGIIKIKDHVENPGQTKLKDGAIRLGAGGALFALPMVFEAMMQTMGEGQNVSTPQLNKVKWNLGSD